MAELTRLLAMAPMVELTRLLAMAPMAKLTRPLAMAPIAERPRPLPCRALFPVNTAQSFIHCFHKHSFIQKKVLQIHKNMV